MCNVDTQNQNVATFIGRLYIQVSGVLFLNLFVDLFYKYVPQSWQCFLDELTTIYVIPETHSLCTFKGKQSSY